MPPKRKAKATKSSGIDTSWRKKVRAEDKERQLFLQAEDEDLKDKEFQILVDSRYTSVFPPSTPQKAQRQHRWWWTGPTPLSDPEKLPPLWNCAEPDLDDDDIEGQIQRCHERIGDNIMPEIFRRRLARYEARKEEKDKLMASEPGLEWEVVQRVKDLTAIRQNLEEDGDPDEEIPNILAIIDAYRNKRLKWKEGKITYWAKGKRIDKNPQEFSWDDFERKAADTGGKGLWVEGILGGPGSGEDFTIGEITAVRGGAAWGHKKLIPCVVNLPGCTQPMHWEFQDDTGAFMAVIDDDDLMDLESQSGKKANVAGYQNAIGIAGKIPIKIVELMITLPSQTHPGQTWLPFFKIFCAVKKRSQGSSERCRILGPWLRHVLYTGTSPDGHNRLFMFDQKSEFRAIPASTIPIGRRWIHHLSYADQLAQAPP